MANTSTPPVISDGYDAWYAAKLWSLIPAIYRARDLPTFPGGVGPLAEMVQRIGSQVAVVRRSIDRLWENESIETCDDWVIPYLGDLLATRLVAVMDARGQRLDVAKTIYYRRHAGTVGLLEELAADVAGRDARVVEFFRRLGRTRHQFDPPIGVPSRPTNPANPTIPIVEGLVGAYSLTQAGGFADLRNTYAADNAGTAFDEYAHTADLRAGAQSSGWYNISHLGVFIWWLQSFPVLAATPCEALGACEGHFTFDPSGREIPLFAPASRTSASFGENWVTPNEWELQVPIREVLWKTAPNELYPTAFWVGLGAGSAPAQLPASALEIYPEIGRFKFVGSRPLGSVLATYHFGFLSEIGAGGFDQSVLSSPNPVTATTVSVSGGVGLDTALAGITASTTIQITDSLTYPGLSAGFAVPANQTLVLAAENQRRPVVRWPGTASPTLTITGGPNAALVIQGIWFQGANIVLAGSFASVTLRLVTLDPGTSPPEGGAGFFDTAIDGTTLQPVNLFVEGVIKELVLERCIVGPIRTRNGGAVEQLTATDSILQSIPTHAPGGGSVVDPANLAAHLKSTSDSLAQSVVASLPSQTVADLNAYAIGTYPAVQLQQELSAGFSAQTAATRAQMEAAYPLALADLALGFSSGTVSLSRCTVLGPTATHRMEASESIFDGIATVEDSQHGCVRFSAYLPGSDLHQPYRSVVIADADSLFMTRRFGQPSYARLVRDADAQIVIANPGDTILGGAQNGAEMGAFCLEAVTLKKRGLALKFVEFMPLGVLPVWIDAD